MQGMPLIARTILLDFATTGFQLLIAGTRVVALFALGAGQSYNISRHGFFLFGIKRDRGKNSPARRPKEYRY